MGDVRREFMKPLLQVFAMPKAEDPEGWMLTYCAVLQTFSDDILAKAASNILAIRTARSFPLPAECSVACKETIEAEAIKKQMGGEIERRMNRQQQKAHIEQQRFEKADELFAKCPFAREALASEWWWRLWTWIKDEQRIPDQHEVKLIKAEGMKMFGEYRDALIDNIFSDKLKNWRDVAFIRIGSIVKSKDGEIAA